MKLLKEIVREQGIQIDGKAIHREAVRGVIIKDNRLLMIFSPNGGDYKFPGGGVKTDESYESGLFREISEESGAELLYINDELGKVVEFDIPIEEDYDVFKMVSYYYACEVDLDFNDQSLDQYEKDLGFIPVWVDIDKAIMTNQVLIDSNKCPSWTPRETFVLKYIKENLNYIINIGEEQIE